MFQLLVPGSGSISTPSTTACDVTARVLTSDASSPSGGSTQQTMYSASGLLSYPRVAGLTDTVYSSAYATQGYVPFGTDPSAFYSPLVSWSRVIKAHTSIDCLVIFGKIQNMEQIVANTCKTNIT